MTLLRLGIVSWLLAAAGHECPGSALASALPARALLNHHQPCSWTSELPCTQGECKFEADAAGKLSRSGACADEAVVRLGNKGIANLTCGLWHGLSAATQLKLNANKLTLLQPGVFEGLGELQALDLSDNELVSLPTSWLVDNA
mgnify:CR=1 FL=1|jgi:hypothetical protein